MAPLAIWLLWQDRSLWRLFAALFALHAALVLGSGNAVAWLEVMFSYELAPGITVGPTAWVGRWWLLAGIPLSAWLTWRGHIGWASLAASPYITPQYLLVVLWELAPHHRPADVGLPRKGTTGDAAVHWTDR